MFHGCYVVNDFHDINARFAALHEGLVLQDVHEGSVGAFDLAREDGFSPHVHEYKLIRIGHEPYRAIQSSDRAIRFGEQGLEVVAYLEISRRKRGQYERIVTARLVLISPGPRRSISQLFFSSHLMKGLDVFLLPMGV